MATNNSANMNATGIQSLNSSGVFNGRTITSDHFTVTNGDGTGGNPTLSLTDPTPLPGAFTTASGSTGSVTNGGTFTIISSLGAATNGQGWQVCAYATNDSTAVRVLGYVVKSTDSTATVDQLATNGCTLSISAGNLILTNTSGITRTFNYGYILVVTG